LAPLQRMTNLTDLSICRNASTSETLFDSLRDLKLNKLHVSLKPGAVITTTESSYSTSVTSLFQNTQSPHLQNLFLGLEDCLLPASYLRNLSNRKRLHLYECNLTQSAAWEALAGMPHLTELYIEEVTVVETHMRFPPTLQKLFFHAYAADDEEGVGITGSFMSTFQNTQLVDLELNSLDISEDFLGPACRFLPHLQRLVVTYCSEITGGFLVSLPGNSPALSTLWLSKCESLNDEAMQTGLKKLNSLQELSITDCSNISSEFLTSLQEKKDLRVLDRSQTSISGEWLSKGLAQTSTLLERLHLPRCSNITGSFCNLAITRFRNLSLLDMRGTTIKFGDSQMAQLSHLPLETLSLGNHPDLTSISLPLFTKKSHERNTPGNLKNHPRRCDRVLHPTQPCNLPQSTVLPQKFTLMGTFVTKKKK